MRLCPTLFSSSRTIHVPRPLPAFPYSARPWKRRIRLRTCGHARGGPSRPALQLPAATIGTTLANSRPCEVGLHSEAEGRRVRSPPRAFAFYSSNACGCEPNNSLRQNTLAGHRPTFRCQAGSRTRCAPMLGRRAAVPFALTGIVSATDSLSPLPAAVAILGCLPCCHSLKHAGHTC
ncbi:hypothetical protein N657DRAFT_134182 [Parathielavia appendiculata]|uniref:Uncharacterized protein n=1 Tax=Parathielavia appendiculata TaxID=2587402 RepID=A0AAN6Z0I0_9PEZI|nr:hypothetical protein N657DRAFT_134182 [Parathielavia appendiculata]